MQGGVWSSATVAGNPEKRVRKEQVTVTSAEAVVVTYQKSTECIHVHLLLSICVWGV